ncbi:MAG: NADH-quinone oxidoreductase subunit J [Alphaproteobacteria bacterium]|nr:MAG: NADH-quinone oxidoreductase subunit J [Alphaproteobacteria bacterium]
MSLELLTFYLFSAVTILSGLMVISARHPVHAVLWLILAFFNAAGLFLLLGAEFLAMILVIVYVGAVAVLFLFVVMMLDVDFVALRQGFLKYLPVGGLIGGILLCELLIAARLFISSPRAVKIAEINAAKPVADGMHNTKALGQLIYTDYFLIFQMAGMILLLAMIGAIVLTLRERVGVRHQVIAEQVYRKPSEAMEIKQVPVGVGVRIE